ncbi:MAG: lipocalin family protein [Rhodothermaceae bacterium]
MKFLKYIVLTILFVGCNKEYLPLKTVNEVNLEKYSGLWYEIARLPNRFQEDCYGSTAEYKIIDETTIDVVNSCFEDSLSGELTQASGTAFLEDPNENGKLEVQFFWPFRGDYWIIALDKQNYDYVMVGTPSRKYLWILGRSQKFIKTVLDSLITYASENKFETDKLIFEKSIKLED